MKANELQLNTMDLTRLMAIYSEIKANNDVNNSIKLVDLYDKLEKEHFIVSFAGHFSAGKSSIINYLLGKDILPNSPIPTSANIVKVSSGEGVARVFFNEETTVEYDEPYDIDMIKDYCMNKDTISRLEISTSEPILPKNSFVLDTPGIDAADDADRLMTESALHLVDVLYYVMDYNHVQSEVNLYFLKEIQAQGIPIYIIINQIDKHNEAEIPFSVFEESVKQTFNQWKITPFKIYYTSALNEQARHNQIVEVKQDLFALLKGGRLDNKRLIYAIERIISSHQTFLEEEIESELISFVEDNLDGFDIFAYQDIEEQLNLSEQLLEKVKNEYFSEVTETLKNAYLMPASLRDKASRYLESEQRNFKVGFIGSRKKTADEKALRLDDFLTPLRETINSTITWKLREKIVELIQGLNMNDETILQKAQEFNIDFDEATLLSFVKDGATINGNYILNYTNEVSAEIKSRFRQAANILWALIENEIKQEVELTRSSLIVKLEEFEHLDSFIAEDTRLAKQLKGKLAQLTDKINNPEENEQIITEIKNKIKEQNQTIKEVLPVLDEQVIIPDVIEVVEKQVETTEDIRHSVNDITKIIDKTIEELNSMAVFDSIVSDLVDKKERLNNRELTIALFGAFSAGKSSFSNALFGEQVLPVSPNPTTAVISRISKVTEELPHGTVVITCKNEATLTTDLQMITKDLAPEADDFTEMIDWIRRGHIQYSPLLNNMYQAYLNAILQGYEHHKDLLGKQVKISLDQFESYVTDESKACYIEAVDLYYDCELTQKGITLVDTPGADSVNARHTNVAFDYIKQADAILYVTYFNHAITSADRDFLMQLGRVKEAFELDKMFFIVNASDLAQNETDLKLVLDYVEEQLLQFGIRQPNIYPVSSKLSLEEKNTGKKLNNEMKQFEDIFYTFIEEDLAKLTIESAIWDINRAKAALQNFIDSANLSGSEQQKLIKNLKNLKEECTAIIHNSNQIIAKNQIEERITRQLHFTLERIYIRFHEMFTQFFNPTTITAAGKKGQAELKLNTNRFLDYIGYELLQEVRAVSLRIEALMKELLKEINEQIERDIREIDESFIIPSMQEQVFVTPVLEQAYSELDHAIFSQALKLYKNPKSFFEQNERDKMKQAFYETIKPLAEKYLDENKNNIQDAYIKQWDEAVTKMKDETTRDVTDMIDNNIKMMVDAIDLDVLERKLAALKSILTQNKG